MKQWAVAILAEYLSHRPIGRIVGLKPVRDDDYVLAIEDIRDERVHVGRTPLDFEPWLRSVKEGRYVLPAFGLCGRCGEIHCDRDLHLEIFRTCIRVRPSSSRWLSSSTSRARWRTNRHSIGPPPSAAISCRREGTMAERGDGGRVF